MKQAFRLTIFLLGVGLLPLSAQETNRWTFFQSLDWSGRLEFLTDNQAARSDGEFLFKVLELVDSERIETGSDREVSWKKGVALLSIRLLADHPNPAALSLIARIPLQYRDPGLRAEAWLTLAKLGDRSSIPNLVRALETTNESGSRTKGEEIQAAALIQALGILKASEGFRTVLVASVAWYTPSSGIRSQAKRTLAALVPDVNQALLSLLATEEDLSLKEDVFSSLDPSDSVFVAQVASAILSSVVRLQARDKADQDRTDRLTLATLLAAQKATNPPASLVPSLKVLILRGQNQDSLVQSIRLLAKIQDPSALSLLVSTLTIYNGKQRGGANGPQDLAMVKELFQALAATGKVDARIPLEEARYSDYPPALVRDAQTALEALPRD